MNARSNLIHNYPRPRCSECCMVLPVEWKKCPKCGHRRGSEVAEPKAKVQICLSDHWHKELGRLRSYFLAELLALPFALMASDGLRRLTTPLAGIGFIEMVIGIIASYGIWFWVDEGF